MSNEPRKEPVLSTTEGNFTRTILLIVLFIALVNGTPTILSGRVPDPLLLDSFPKWGTHAMIFPNLPDVEKSRYLEAAHDLRVGVVRLDLNWPAAEPREGIWQWQSIDTVVRMNSHLGMKGLGVLGYTPRWASVQNAPDGKFALYPPTLAKLEAWKLYVRSAVNRYKKMISYWEIWNEPNHEFFRGTSSDYARLLSTAYEEIKREDSTAFVVLGGLVIKPGWEEWMRIVLTDSANPCTSRFDIPNIHLRGNIPYLKMNMKQAAEWFAANGYRAPVWVTEFGYPSNPDFQYDGSYRGTDISDGEEKQCQFLQQAAPALFANGAGVVFITLRDIPFGRNKEVPYNSEGLLRLDGSRKKSFECVRSMILK